MAHINSGIHTVLGHSYVGEDHADPFGGHLPSYERVMISAGVWAVFYWIAIIGALLHHANPIGRI